VGSRDGAELNEQERLAVEYAEGFAVDLASIGDQFMERLRRSFTDSEILDLTICVSASATC